MQSGQGLHAAAAAGMPLLTGTGLWRAVVKFRKICYNNPALCKNRPQSGLRGNRPMPSFQESKSAQDILAFHCPRFQELPNIDLYMDQVISLADKYLSVFAEAEGDKSITSTMVNNYVKQKVIAPPSNKKYAREQVACLLFICVAKQVLSISDIGRLLHIQQETYTVEKAYDYFCTELELALQAVFGTRDFSHPNTASRITPETELLRSAVMSFAHKIYVTKNLLYRQEMESSAGES